MRKQQRNQILDIFLMFKEAHSQLQSGSEQERREILASCQETAIEVGEIIEKEAGECQVITRLEEYCDLLYAALGRLATEEPAEICTRLDAQADAAAEEFIREIPTDYVVVFLPYKASMWDSMESVWKAFCRDKDCVSMVVPIPYFTRDQSGRAEDVHYEGGLFPDHVPVTYYDKVDLEKLHPDVIFIHNPYDANNFVTSIHTDYYCSRIHEYTDKLVYIPYFVSMEQVDRSYCLQPGIVYSDIVILQSEIIKEQYKRYFEEVYGVKESINKFAAIGSPKFDGVMKEKKEFHMPMEWKNAIGEKKVLLYNTHLKSLLDNGEEGIMKMESTIEFMRAQQDVLLWWRPHPLSEATARAMRPELLDRYYKLVNRCKKDVSIIYDDTADMDRAIVYSDGYYGDYSSLMPLYLMTGKPVLHQQVLYKMNEGYPVFMDCMAEDEYYCWYPSWKSNGLYRTDKKTFETELVCRLDEEDNKSSLYGGICLYRDKVVLIPRLAKHIGIWDCSRRKISYIPVKLAASKYKEVGKFAGNIVYGKYIFIFGVRCPVIMRLDMESLEIKYYESWNKKILPFVVAEKPGALPVFVWKDVVAIEEYAFAPVSCAPFVLCINMKTENIQLYRIGKEREGFSTISWDGKSFWLASANQKRIVKWNKENDEMISYSAFPEGFHSSDWALNMSIYMQGIVYFVPSKSNMVIKINTLNGDITSYKYSKNEAADIMQAEESVQILCGKTISILEKNKNSLTEISLPSEEMKEVKYFGAGSDIDFKMYQNGRYIVFEEGAKQLTLGGFLKYISKPSLEYKDSSLELKKRLCSNTDGTSGTEIYHYIKKMM